MEDDAYRRTEPLHGGFFSAPRRCRILRIYAVDAGGNTIQPLQVRDTNGAATAYEGKELAPGEVIHAAFAEGSRFHRVTVEDI